ncbi:MAG: c-type cytochrome [Herminiimonas sp.]|nr:c-type cytochrome [Herminiimonas sp.]
MNAVTYVKKFVAVVLVLLLIPIAIFVYQMLHDPGSGQQQVRGFNADEQIVRGAYLARAGNCMACHTARGGTEFAGGRPIATPFGSIYTSNLTPDRETGLGKWTYSDFWRAMHNGKSKDGNFLYPAFPYPSYTKVTRADSDALYAYLKTLPPVRQAKRENELRFPYNQRSLLAFWRTLYFTPGEFQPSAGQSAEWNRGAYLVQGLGHCAACHTGRNALGGTSPDNDLAGGLIPMLNWYATSLTSDSGAGLGDRHQADIAQLLKTGVSGRDAVFGPMAEVVRQSLQHLSEPDINAMAVYLKSIPKSTAASAPVAVKVGGEGEAIIKLGANLYEQHCVACHSADGKGEASAYPTLAGARSLTGQSAINPIRIVLNGGYPPSTGGNPRPYGMPPFGTFMSDAEVAAVVSYVRSSWGNQGALVSPVEVGRLRSVPDE